MRAAAALPLPLNQPSCGGRLKNEPMSASRQRAGLVSGLMVFGVAVWQVGSLSRSANEPDVARLDPRQEERRLAAVGLVAHVDRIRYLNRDFNAIIFEGKLATALPIKPGVPFEFRSEPSIGGRSGVLIVKSLPSRRDLVGVVVSTTNTEWKQGRAMFWSKWNAQ